MRRALWFLLAIFPTSAFGQFHSLTDGVIFVQRQMSASDAGGYAISFERMIHTTKGKASWYLKGVTVRNQAGKEIAKSSFAQWDDRVGVLYLEDSDRKIELLNPASP